MIFVNPLREFITVFVESYSIRLEKIQTGIKKYIKIFFDVVLNGEYLILEILGKVNGGIEF